MHVEDMVLADGLWASCLNGSTLPKDGSGAEPSSLKPGKVRKNMSAVLMLLFLWYIIYRLNKKEYEEKYHKELKFRDTFNPENWKKMH